jgi:ornithine cyclodeaminase
MIVVSREDVARHLDYPTCIALVRAAMIALSKGETRQMLRSILDLESGDMFGLMPGAMRGTVGAKLITVYPRNFALGIASHQGAILLFDRESGAPAALIEAGEVTAIRTAAASAAATDVMARADARTLAILGYGEQAWRHALAIAHVRPIEHVQIWGRNPAMAEAFAARVASRLAIPATAAASVEAAVAGADIICTTTAASEPILFADQVADGTHLNVVGSSRAGPAEIDNALVARARFIADHREGILAQGAEFLRARAAGLVDDDHVVGEIGEVFSGAKPGRETAAQVTIYKSIGSVVQDLACAEWLCHSGAARGFGQPVPFD